MPTNATRRGSFILSTRILIVGLWTVLFGMFILFFTVQLFATLSTVPGGGLLGGDSGLNVGSMLADSLLLLYRGGFLTLGAGGVLMAFGSLFVIGVAR